jgi:Ankyrin repeats (3 copies)/Ankyrin repeats (many copies)
VSGILFTAEARDLLQLCKVGKLFDVQKWIASGRSISVPDDLRTTPLKVAVGTGFHSLVELLASHTKNEELKNQALLDAVSLKRLDLIQLLVAHGAEVSAIPFIDVLQIWEPTIIRYFIDHGVDVVTDFPFAMAFGEKIRTALRPWRECKEKNPDSAPQLQEQADRALRYFCHEGDLKWVSLLMWVGANPRTRGIRLYDDEAWSNDPDYYTTALEEAAHCKDVQILKRLKLDPENDDIEGLLADAAGSAHVDVVRYLFELGAKPNDKPNGGSTALDRCLSSLWHGSFRHRISPSWYGGSQKASKYEVSDTRETLQLLLEKNALWRPDNADELQSVRRHLYECEPDVTLEIVQLLTKHKACFPDTLHDLLRTPAMKKHLSSEATRFVRLGYDVRTAEQKAQEKRQKEASRKWLLKDLMTKYNREKIYEEIWSEPIQHVAKRYGISDVGFAKVCRKLSIPRPGRGYWAIKAAGKTLPRRPPLSELAI